MRICYICFAFSLLVAGPALSATANPIKVCVFESDTALVPLVRLARQLSSRKLQNGSSLTVVAITEKVPSVQDEQRVTALEQPLKAAPVVYILLTKPTKKALGAELERLDCDYEVEIWLHLGAPDFDMNSLSGVPSSPGVQDLPLENDRPFVAYKLRSARDKKTIGSGSAPPLTIFVRQGRRVFDPYPLFANQIVKKLDRIGSQ